jgi:DNA-directed RNA polymerase beta' subunit
MNMHMPQNVLAETELRTLAAIPYQLISPTGNSPIIGIYQDSMLGSYRFTRPNVKMSHRDAMNLLMMYNNVDMAKLKEVGDMVSSFDVLSQILPPLTMKYKTKLFEDGEDPEITNNIMEIRGGQYLRGQMEKSVLGSGTKGIIHRVCNDFGNMAASNFIDDLQNVVTEYMKSSSFSVGVSDLVADKKTAMEIIQVITDQKMEVQSVIDQVHLGTFKNNTAASNMMEFETKVNNLLNKATEQSGKIGRKSLSKNNRFLMIVNSGSKGSLINISQMISCLGQQNVDGKRIPYGFDSRTLPHFNKYDDSPNARGFIENSYIDGLTAPELFFHAMGGRIGLIDTACKSVTRDTPIVFIENNVPKYMEIGVWIDDKLNLHKDNVTYQTEKNMELLNVENVYIPTVDEDGIVSWGEVTTVTRHDPGERLYEVKTQGGRSVTVAESQSLLVWDSDKSKFLPKNSPDVSIGDYMPVTLDLNDPPNILDMPDIDIEKTVHDISNGIFNPNLICVSQKTVNAIVRELIKRFQSENIYSEEKVSTFDKDLFSIPGFTYKRNPVVMHVQTIEAVNGVSLLCSRAGIQTIIDNQTCTISIKYERIEESINNVFLDPIVSINVIGVENHPKLYDLTIPSTLNFGLANGLQVRDTSSTGYIQRRLIKGLEDLKVEYDMTVRNSKGKIVQFSYGEDGFESSKVENQFINLVEMSVEDIYMHYDIVGLNDYDNDLLLIYTKGTVSRMKKQRTDSKASCKKYIDYMIKARDDIVESVFKYKNENSIKMPVSFQNIIVNIQGQLNLNANSVVDITPLEAFQLIEEYYKKLQQIYFAPPTQLFEVMYYFYLSPRDLLVNKRFHRKALVLLLETIILKYKQSIVHPGEMVGVIAGQATGEPTTQLSILRSEKIKMVRINKNTQIPEMVSGEIGALCDNIITQLPEYTFDTEHKDSVETILEPLDDEYYIVGVDEQERTHWNKISHVSRHIVNGDMIRVTTKSGRTVETTMSHSHLVRKNQSVQPILGSDMKIGMRIPVAKHISNPFVRDSVEIAGKSYVLDHLFGWFIGAYLAEGCLTKKKGKNEANGTISISNVSEYYIENVKKFAERFDRTCRTKSKTGKIMDSEKCYTNTDTSFTYKPLADLLMQTCGTGSFVKHVPDFAFLAPDDFKAGLLAGYFDGDGNFMCDKLHHQIRVCSRSNQLIKDISLLLSYFDIFGSLHKGYRNGANYYHLAISPKYAKRYEQHIGSNLHALKLKTLVEYSERTNAHSLREDIDKINGLGEVIASCGKKLELPGQSRLYGRWEKKEAIGRSTLEKYIELFQYHNKAEFIQTELSILRQAATSSVIWDEIVEIERYTPEQTEYVYDFTVPGNQTFMTDNAVIVHNTLNTFHLSGVASKSNVTRGVPRIEEILRLTKNPKNPSLTIHLKPFDEQEQDKAVKFANMIEHTKLIDLVKSVQICFDPNDSTTFLPEDTLLLEQFYEFEKLVEECNETIDEVVADGPAKSRWIIRMEFNAELLLDKNITMDDIHFAIKHSHYGNEINCVYSDYNMDKLIFRIRVNSNIFSKTKKRGVPEPLDQSDEIYLLKNFQDTLLNNIVMRGIRGIVNVIPRKLQNMVVKEDGKFARKDTWILDTTGTNLLETLALDFIDSRRTFSNDIKEIFNVFGIEAARQTIYNEFVEVMEFADVYINYHHLSLLCDRMTNTKDMVSIFRSGILNDDIGPVSKSTFEVHTEVLLNAARHAELDHMRGVSATVMMGQYGYYGTNAFNLVMDLKEMQKLDSAVVDISDKDAEIEKMFNIKATENDACSKSAIETKNNIANIKRHDTGGCDDDYNMGF